MAYRRIPLPAASTDFLSALRRITPRDRVLLSWLAEHYLLSTEQVADGLYASRRTAQMRLTILHRLDLLTRLRYTRPDGGRRSFLHTLGVNGLHLHPTAYHDPDNPAATAPRSHLDRARRIAASPTLEHLLGVNQFFIDLHAHARTHPDTTVGRWWSEQHATAAYATADIRPDGYGIWQVGHATVGFFLEHDNGTEELSRVIAKLRGYERLAEFGPRYPVLLWVPSRRRETHLLNALHGVRTRMPVATAVHGNNPAGPVWTLTAAPDRALRLHELPSDHGPDAATNSHRYRPAHPTPDIDDDLSLPGAGGDTG